MESSLLLMRIVTVLLIGLALLGLLSWGLTRMQGVMLFHPRPLSGLDPAREGVTCETVAISVHDGTTLGAWWCPTEDQGRPALLFLHGNAGNREGRLHNVRGLQEAGISVLIVDYRGYGESSGIPSEGGLIRDALAAYDWLAERVAPRPVAIFGRSLGGVLGALVARERQPAGLIVESTFTSLGAITRHVLPVPALHLLVRSRLNTLAAIRELDLPLMVIHGAGDELVPVEMGRALYDASPSAHKVWHEVPDGQHNDTYFKAGPAYFQWMRAFLDGLQS